MRVAVAAAVFAAWDVVLDPQMVQAGYWTWAGPRPGLPGIDTVPLTNLAGWLLAGAVLMSLLDPLVHRTSGTGSPRIGDAAPLVALAWMTLGGALATSGGWGCPGRRRGGGARRPGARRPAGAAPAGGEGPPVSGRIVRALAVVSVAGAVHAVVNLALLRRPPPDPPPVRRPVTVVLPVRDEETQVAGCLAAVLDQRGIEDLRVVVVDDGSTDGTADVVRAVYDHRVRLLRADPRPRLAGETARLRDGGERPRSDDEVLVFVDADVRLFPDAIAAAVAVLDEHGLDLVSPWPRLLAEGLAERLVQPLVPWLWATTLPVRLAERPRGPRSRRPTASSWCSPAAATNDPAGTRPSAARCSRTSPCCAR